MNLADTLVIKQQNLFLIALRDGCLPQHDPHPLGLYFQDCRHLSAYEWRLNGEVPLLLQASDARGGRALHELTNPPLTLSDGSTVAPQSLSLRLDRMLDEPANMRERLVLSSHHHENVRLDLELHVAAYFASMLAIRGLVQSNTGPVDPEVNGDGLVFSAMGRDGILRSIRIETREAPRRLEGGRLLFDAEIRAGGTYELESLFSVAESGNGVARGAARRRSAPERTRISSDDELFHRVLARSLQDLDLLRSHLGGHSYFAAGVPWFATLFGRDSLITAIEALSFVRGDPEQTLRLRGGMLGRQIDHNRDEEPGKVLHELRVGEPANVGETPFARWTWMATLWSNTRGARSTAWRPTPGRPLAAPIASSRFRVMSSGRCAGWRGCSTSKARVTPPMSCARVPMPRRRRSSASGWRTPGAMRSASTARSGQAPVSPRTRVTSFGRAR